MCYDIKASIETQLKRAERKGDLSAVTEILENLIPFTDLPLFHASGFSHPELLIYTSDAPEFPKVATWGLVPHWVKNQEQQQKTWNSTLNARAETIFEKPSFKASALHKRCLIYIDGFFEHHQYNKKVYPFFIQRHNHKSMALAGLWSEWINPEHGGKLNTFSIVTTKGNSLMSKIHNNPKIKEPRMPFILTDDLEEQWLHSENDMRDASRLQNLLKSYTFEDLKAHTVEKLRGKNYLGNVEETANPVLYEDLTTDF
ncbi:SOS response-associated peptidase [Winogradskyella eckloniae]|uniref:SOS response-associated peptidase n=1 Tax=Winogradskyella eckloniae TaxID=1089306 RepID=UPI0015633D33|nr:SOS response-associated peptidase [Winogradskyella eckloniae]NRD21405.1 SOS response-associated peptidase [Winogradskyella eckloniae]